MKAHRSEQERLDALDASITRIEEAFRDIKQMFDEMIEEGWTFDDPIEEQTEAPRIV
jgi:hypothetical protein